MKEVNNENKLEPAVRTFAEGFIGMLLSLNARDVVDRIRLDAHKDWTIKRFIEHCGRDQALIDWVLDRLCEAPVGVFPLGVRVEIALMGASSSHCEREIGLCIKQGRYRFANQLAKRCGRELTEQEVRRIGAVYVGGALESDRIEEEVANLFLRVIGKEGVREFKNAVRAKKEKCPAW